MIRAIQTCIVLFGLFGFTAALAHHAWPVSRDALVTVSGTVTSFDWSNPHPMMEVVVQTADGSSENWQIGGPAINRMMANGWSRDTVKPGDTITGTGYQFNNGEKIIRLEHVVQGDGSQLNVYGR